MSHPTVMLDRERSLRFTMGALRKLKKELGGRNPLDPEEGEALFSTLDPDTLPALLWAALIHEDPTLTVDVVADLYDFTRLNEIHAKVMHAFTGKDPAAKVAPAAEEVAPVDPPTAPAS